MTLDTLLIVRVSTKFKGELERIALENGVTQSALLRNTLVLGLLKPHEPNQVELILKKIKMEAENELYGRNDNGQKEE